MAFYDGDLIKDGNIAEGLSNEISKKNELVVLKHGKPPYRIVIGVPHHAKVGESHICENNRDSDENAASYAIAAYNDLKKNAIPAKLVIMAHATGKDPNKDKESSYFQEIFDEPAEILFECHGASKDRKNDLEISAGSNKLSDTLKFGELLANSLKNKVRVAIQKRAGTNEALIVEKDGTTQEGILATPGTKTVSLIAAGQSGIAAFHLEAKPHFRKKDNNKEITITEDGRHLGEAIAKAIIEYR